MKKVIIISHCFLLLLLGSITYAQIPEIPKSVQSPNVAGLGLYGEVPVSHFTGLPNIEIPLYLFEDKQIKVPISLSYHASGFRPDQHPGWVGMGWNLIAGGVISRTIKDVPDEYNNPYLMYTTNAGFYFRYSVLNQSNWDQVTGMMDIVNSEDGEGVFKDTEPDEFSFSFPGGNGKFYLDHTGAWKVKSDRPVKVIFNNTFLNVPTSMIPPDIRMYSYNSPSFSGFTLIDENGTQYVFGGNTNAIEYSVGLFDQETGEWFAQSWYLVKIINVQGYEINFVYERDDYINQMYIAAFNNLETKVVNSGGILSPTCSSWYYYPLEFSYNGTLISPVYLKTIQGPKNKINFSRSTTTELRYQQSLYELRFIQSNLQDKFLPILVESSLTYPECLNKLQWKKLDKIEIEDDGAAVIRTYKLNYNNLSTDRLKLLSLNEYGEGLSGPKTYSFNYDETLPLPAYLANKTDHWGFYNGTFADISNQSTYVNTYYNFKEPNATYLYTGTLNKITYPTGGVTEFTYEPHYYSQRLKFSRTDGIDPAFNANTMAGGLRIKKITSYDPAIPEAKYSKEYYYVRGYQNGTDPATLLSSGVLGGQSKYFFDDYRLRSFNNPNVTYSTSIFSSQSVLPVSDNSKGCHVGYSEIVEKNTDGGYSKYYYTNFENGHIDEPSSVLQYSRTAYEPFNSMEEERGKLIKEEQYNKGNGILLQRTIDYIALNKSNEYVRSTKARYFNVCPGASVKVCEATAYKMYTYSYLPSKEVTTTYQPNSTNPLSITKTFTYDAATRLLRTEQVTDSKGRVFKTNYQYPGDYNVSGAGTDAWGSGIKMLQSKNISSWVTEKYTELTDQSVSKVIDASLTKFNTLRPLPDAEYKLESIDGITGFTPAVISMSASTINSNYKLQRNFDSFDAYGNPQQVHNINNLNEVYVWGYKGRYLLAKIISNSSYSTLTQNLSTSILDNPANETVLNQQLDLLRQNSSTLVTTYSYNPLRGLSQETDTRGRKTTYEYDEFQRLKLIRDHEGNILKTFTYKYKL
ncbi:hypothetical protein DVR12_16630 [Chitinophaga silvatica]|uniref:YD repeat-containing protein n=1 Tax=Chitinophaga silvatica TaxID=2282649 RepID=A0A3E1Y7C6_9BACT|nr:hypothetical protein [Chitinophaga silvatica]RFS20977.1 hypothetical protein DVR12_16630 [Chitinophaga silvatica]